MVVVFANSGGALERFKKASTQATTMLADFARFPFTRLVLNERLYGKTMLNTPCRRLKVVKVVEMQLYSSKIVAVLVVMTNR